MTIARPRGLAWPKTRKRVSLPRPQSEAAFQAAIVNVARSFGWLDYHTLDSRGSPPGFPDLVLLRPPRGLVVEVKSKRGVLSGHQELWLDRFGRCGFEVYVWRAGVDDIRTIADILAPVGQRPLGVQKAVARTIPNRVRRTAAPTRAAPEPILKVRRSKTA